MEFEVWNGVDETLGVGGPVVYLLLGLSVIVMAVTIVKLWQFLSAGVVRGARSASRAVLTHRRGHSLEALSEVERRHDVRARIVACAIRGKVASHASDGAAREEVTRQAGEELENLQGYLRLLEVIGTLAPLLGLFGTVLGMIEAFRALEAAGNQVDPSILSGGIWQALLTTAVGLAVAVPAMIAFGYFERHLERLARDLDNLITQVFVTDFDTPVRGQVSDVAAE